MWWWIFSKNGWLFFQMNTSFNSSTLDISNDEIGLHDRSRCSSSSSLVSFKILLTFQKFQYLFLIHHLWEMTLTKFLLFCETYFSCFQSNEEFYRFFILFDNKPYPFPYFLHYTFYDEVLLFQGYLFPIPCFLNIFCRNFSVENISTSFTDRF